MLDFKIIGLSFFQILALAISVILILIINKKFKLNKYQWQLFIMTTLFWTSIKLIRSFRKALAIDVLGANEIVLIASIVGAYGLISIFVRLPIGIISDKLKDRKIFIYISSALIVISSGLVFFYPNFTTMYTSALMIGVGASVWGLLNVMFAESFKGKNKYIAVSIISIAPLLADYIAAPLQEFALTSEDMGYKYLWLFSSLFALGTILYTFTIKEIKLTSKGFSYKTLVRLLSNKKLWHICIIGFGVLMIKFANSGTNAIQFGYELGMPVELNAFFDTMFSLPQLIAGIFAGTYMVKRIGVRNTLIIGLGFTLTFNLFSSVLTNDLYIVLFFLYTLNGIGYGITYNVLIGLALNDYEGDERATAMGFYQTILAIGIFFGSTFSSYVADSLGSYRSVFTVLSIITLLTLIITIFIKENE